MRLSLLPALFLVCIARAESPPEQLLGLWHSVSATTPEGRDITPQGGGLELQFGRDGTLVQTIVAPARGEEPIRYSGRFTFTPPDKITYAYSRAGEENTQHQRFHVDGDLATFENLDSGVITKMRRIQKSEFRTPRNIPELPK